MNETLQVCGRPEEGKWFKVNPLTIDQALFQEARASSEQEMADKLSLGEYKVQKHLTTEQYLKDLDAARQEKTRKLILEAFDEVKANPEKYGKPFKTLRPKMTWSWKTGEELKELASSLGDHIADWVEQALEWAQRIQNGETWQDICNKPEYYEWYRAVVWKNGYIRCIGGSEFDRVYVAASAVGVYNCYNNGMYYDMVPLVVSYK